MSIHTILSQMEKKLDAVIVPQHTVLGVEMKGVTDPIREVFRSFHTQIVEEAQREERERILKELHELPVVLVDVRMDSTNQEKYEHGVMYDKVKEIVCTKLQKMKGSDKHE